MCPVRVLTVLAPRHSVRRAVLRSAASAPVCAVRVAAPAAATTPFVRSVAAQAAYRPASLAVAARFFSQTARVANVEEKPAAPEAAAEAPAAAEPAATVSDTTVLETPYGVFVRNIVFDATEAHLKEAFEHYGKVTHTAIARDARGVSKGFAFIWYEDAGSRDKALEEANGSFWHGRRLTVAPRTGRSSSDKPAAGGASGRTARPPRSMNPPSNGLYIGNLPYETTDADLNALFGTLEGVKAVRVAVDRSTGWPRGFAHADFDTTENATAALEALSDKTMGSRKLRLDYSVAKPARNASASDSAPAPADSEAAASSQ